MIIVYAFGYGLGHLNRVVSYLQSEEICLDTVLLLTNSPYTSYLPSEIRVFWFDTENNRNIHQIFNKLTDLIFQYKVTEIIVDVFPSGFYGELIGLDTIDLPKILLARVLNPHYFQNYPTAPLYTKIIVVEPGVAVERYRYENIKRVQLDLSKGYARYPLLPKHPFFVILHSGPRLEVLRLYKKAFGFQKKGEHIYIQTYSSVEALEKIPEVSVIYQQLPIRSLLEGCDLLFTACGFNTFWTTASYRKKQHVIPFARRYDDQFLRKRLADR